MITASWQPSLSTTLWALFWQKVWHRSWNSYCFFSPSAVNGRTGITLQFSQLVQWTGKTGAGNWNQRNMQELHYVHNYNNITIALQSQSNHATIALPFSIDTSRENSKIYLQGILKGHWRDTFVRKLNLSSFWVWPPNYGIGRQMIKFSIWVSN